MANTSATWVVELNCECPKCKGYVDLLDDPEFWYKKELEISERKDGLMVVCPECDHQFLVDCEY